MTAFTGLAYAEEVQIRPPAVYLLETTDERFFDPEFARWIYETKPEYSRIDQMLQDTPDDGWRAFKDWKAVLEEDVEGARSSLLNSPHRDEIERVYDIFTIFYAWRRLYRFFPNYVMSYEAWQADMSPDCTERHPSNRNITACLPVPDWRNESEKSADAASLEKGNRARADWKASPCKRIYEEDTSMFAPYPDEWFQLECDTKLELIGYERDPDR